MIRRLYLLYVLLVIVAIAFLSTDVQARERKQVYAFKKLVPCPATGKAKGNAKCPGYVVDHVIPLCASGDDHPSNMQWQSIAEAKAKDRLEREMCHRPR